MDDNSISIKRFFFFFALLTCGISVEKMEKFQRTALSRRGELSHASVYLSSSYYLSMLLLKEFGSFQFFRKMSNQTEMFFLLHWEMSI